MSVMLAEKLIQCRASVVRKLAMKYNTDILTFELAVDADQLVFRGNIDCPNYSSTPKLICEPSIENHNATVTTGLRIRQDAHKLGRCYSVLASKWVFWVRYLALWRWTPLWKLCFSRSELFGEIRQRDACVHQREITGHNSRVCFLVVWSVGLNLFY